MVSPISLVVPDAGPLISLAMADRLDLLDEFAVSIATLDVVKAECLYLDWPGRAALRRRHTTTLVLTEDVAFGDGALGRDVHVLSTRAFLQTLEALEIIGSAKAILDDIERRGRKVAPYIADRPALGGASGRTRSSWKSALRRRD